MDNKIWHTTNPTLAYSHTTLNVPKFIWILHSRIPSLKEWSNPPLFNTQAPLQIQQEQGSGPCTLGRFLCPEGGRRELEDKGSGQRVWVENCSGMPSEFQEHRTLHEHWGSLCLVKDTGGFSCLSIPPTPRADSMRVWKYIPGFLAAPGASDSKH